MCWLCGQGRGNHGGRVPYGWLGMEAEPPGGVTRRSRVTRRGGVWLGMEAEPPGGVTRQSRVTRVLQLLDFGGKLCYCVFGAAEEHHGFVFEEEFVLYAGEACAHAAFDDDRVFGFVYFEDGHPVNGAG